MAKIDDAMIKRINDIYLELGVKSKVAKRLGISPATVTKYLIDGYASIEEDSKFEGEIKSGLVPELKGLGLAHYLLMLTPEEKEEIVELQKGIFI